MVVSSYIMHTSSPTAVLVVFFTIALNVTVPTFPAKTFGLNIVFLEKNPPGDPIFTNRGFEGNPIRLFGLTPISIGNTIAT